MIWPFRLNMLLSDNSSQNHSLAKHLKHSRIQDSFQFEKRHIIPPNLLMRTHRKPMIRELVFLDHEGTVKFF
jgi:hypothetical protein